jgi:hypothetical protein
MVDRSGKMYPISSGRGRELFILRGVLMGTGVIAVLVGSQLPWGEFDTNFGPQPVVFFLDLSQIGTIVAVLAAALGMLGLVSCHVVS